MFEKVRTRERKKTVPSENEVIRISQFNDKMIMMRCAITSSASVMIVSRKLVPMSFGGPFWSNHITLTRIREREVVYDSEIDERTEGRWRKAEPHYMTSNNQLKNHETRFVKEIICVCKVVYVLKLSTTNITGKKMIPVQGRKGSLL